MNDLSGKDVLVVGLGKSGISASNLLIDKGARVFAIDEHNVNDYQLNHLIDKGLKVSFGNNMDKFLNHYYDFVIKSPGIPYTNKWIKFLNSRNLPIYSEIELASWFNKSELIGITGTNGKTTVTTLITNILKTELNNVICAGNIGIPASDVVKDTSNDGTLVLELSSFMLKSIYKLHPHIAVITNTYTAHIDWHGSRNQYIKDKLNITLNQNSNDYLILNWDLDEHRQLSGQFKAKIIKISSSGNKEADCYLKNNQIYWHDELVIDLSSLTNLKTQNKDNILDAIAVAKLKNINNKDIALALSNFCGIKHRLQFVDTINGRQFYNDSKSTDIEATENALNNFDQKVILLAGGLDRGISFDNLVNIFKDKVKAIVLSGETKYKLKDTAIKAGIKNIILVDDIKSAVNSAYKLSNNKDIILLSPACASWDQYDNFEQRGDLFIEAVEKLKG